MFVSTAVVGGVHSRASAVPLGATALKKSAGLCLAWKSAVGATHVVGPVFSFVCARVLHIVLSGGLHDVTHMHALKHLPVGVGQRHDSGLLWSQTCTPHFQTVCHTQFCGMSVSTWA